MKSGETKGCVCEQKGVCDPNLTVAAVPLVLRRGTTKAKTVAETGVYSTSLMKFSVDQGEQFFLGVSGKNPGGQARS